MAGYSEQHYPEGATLQQRRLQLVGPADEPQPRRRIDVLYVEDDEDDIYLLGHQMQALPSFEVNFVHASTLPDARFEVTHARYDIILCDFWLGSETTIPLIDDIKSMATPIPIVLVSSLENDDIELIGRRAGADGFVAKGDLTAASLDRVFTTLLPARPVPARRDGGVAVWLKSLLRSLDRVHAASALALSQGGQDESARLGEFLDEILGTSEAARADILDKLAGLERATRQGAGTNRFDAVPYVADAIRKQMNRARGGAIIDFRPPALPIVVESSATLFGDLVEGFFAEAGDLAERGIPVGVTLAVDQGYLVVTQCADVLEVPEIRADITIVEAAASERRFLIETLARASGGAVRFPSGDAEADVEAGVFAELMVPLRLADGSAG